MSRERLEEHRKIWQRKGSLERVYRVWFDALLQNLPHQGRILEVGAGPGFLSAYARRRFPELTWLSMDVLEVPWNDLVGDALRIPLRDESFERIVGLDLLHHLAEPASFFEEARRLLLPRGELALVEPWVTAFSYPIYRWLHHEGCSLSVDPWHPFESTNKDAFEGDAAIPWRLVRQTSPEHWQRLGFRTPRIRRWNGFAYLLSGGFKKLSLLPPRAAPVAIELDELTRWAAPLLGVRALAVWERVAPGATQPSEAQPQADEAEPPIDGS